MKGQCTRSFSWYPVQPVGKSFDSVTEVVFFSNEWLKHETLDKTWIELASMAEFNQGFSRHSKAHPLS